MDSVQPRIDPVSRYGAVNPTDGVQPAGRATVGNRNASQAADTTATPASTTTVTLSRRAQELSAQQTREESRENVQQASDAAQARQDADDAVAANAVAANAVASQGNASGANNADRASGTSPRDAQVRRAYQASEGAASVA